MLVSGLTASGIFAHLLATPGGDRRCRADHPLAGPVRGMTPGVPLGPSECQLRATAEYRAAQQAALDRAQAPPSRPRNGAGRPQAPMKPIRVVLGYRSATRRAVDRSINYAMPSSHRSRSRSAICSSSITWNCRRRARAKVASWPCASSSAMMPRWRATCCSPATTRRSH